MSTYKALAGYLSLFLLLGWAAGCGVPKGQEDPAGALPLPETSPPAKIVQQPNSGKPGPAIPDRPKHPATEPEDKVSLASNEAEPEPGTPPASKPKGKINNPYTQAKPTLLGLELKTPADTVKELFGQPKEQFVIEEDTPPVTVYDYGDFMIGFTMYDELEFIDIRSSEIDPGLNGLVLGDKVADALEALGKPDTNTSYVLTYKSPNAILKLDIDPATDTIISIKLFTD